MWCITGTQSSNQHFAPSSEAEKAKLEVSVYGRAETIYRGAEFEERKTKFVRITLGSTVHVSLSDTQKFCTAASRETCLGRFVRQCESDMFLCECSERETSETCSNLLESKKFGELSGKTPPGARN